MQLSIELNERLHNSICNWSRKKMLGMTVNWLLSAQDVATNHGQSQSAKPATNEKSKRKKIAGR